MTDGDRGLEELVAEAIRLGSAGDCGPRALTVNDQIVRRRPTDVGARIRLARCAVAAGEYDRALQELDEAALWNPTARQVGFIQDVRDDIRCAKRLQEWSARPSPASGQPVRGAGRSGAIVARRPAKSRVETIREEVTRRRISEVLHFTTIENLHHILSSGSIQSRGALEAWAEDFLPNDLERVDGQIDAICLSISWPNCGLFWKFRRHDYPDQGWAVLALAPRLLWECDCAFCRSNAASSSERGKPIQQRKSAAAFAGMFEPWDGKPSRAELGLADCFPTNPQAEVLCFSDLPVSLVTGIYVKTFADRRQLAPRKLPAPLVDDPKYFGFRADYNYWKTT